MSYFFNRSETATAKSSEVTGNTDKFGRSRGEPTVLLPRTTIKEKSPTKSSIELDIVITTSAKALAMRKAVHLPFYKMKTQRTSKKPIRHHRH